MTYVVIGLLLVAQFVLLVWFFGEMDRWMDEKLKDRR